MARSAIKIYLKSAIESGFSFIRKRFNNLDELNDNFRAQRDWIFEKMEKKADFKRRLAKVLEVLKMHSCKYIGISFLTENRLCEAYEAQHGESISKRSVNTYIKQLKEVGFITTMAAKREDGKQTANIVVIERFKTTGERQSDKHPAHETGERKAGKSAREAEGNVPSENVAYKGAENLHTKKTTSPPKTSLKESKERMAKDVRLLNFVPAWFKERIGCCAMEAREVHEYWKVCRYLMRRTFGSLMGAKEWQGTVNAAIREFYLSAKASTRGKFQMHNVAGQNWTRN